MAIWFSKRAGAHEKCNGDAIVYEGREMSEWREASTAQPSLGFLQLEVSASFSYCVLMEDG